MKSQINLVKFFGVILLTVFCAASSARCPGFYGMTPEGGAGTIFICDSHGYGMTILKSFESAAGKNPSTELCKTSNGKFYGMTYRGGKDDYGILYEWDPLKNSFTKKLDVESVGYWPSGALVEADNGKLYGMTQYKGAKNQGVLFEFDPLTNNCSVLHEFNEEVNGKFPLSALVKGTAGRLYGTTRYGGKNGKGVLFEWNTENAVFTKKFDFDNTRGSDPRGLTGHSVNGKFYGLTWSGGTGSGVLYEWDPVNNVCTWKASFNGTENGRNPMGYLIQAHNGKLYGMTYSGGSSDLGVIFEWDPATNIFKKVFDFKGAETGYYPYGSLTEAANHKIYGMTAYGGLYGLGVLFEWDPASDMFSKKLDFNDTNGAMPHSAFANMDNGNLIGTTFSGGPANAGVLFEWNPDTDEYIHKFNFESDVNGSSDSILNETACDNYNFNGKILRESGTYYDTIPGATGCDSLITLNLTVLKSTAAILFETACSEYIFNGRTLETSGTYFDRIPNAAGCDSIIVLFLTIVQPTSSDMSVTACNEFRFGDEMITQSGNYKDTLLNSAGCDSIITLHLAIDHVDTAVIQDRSVLISLDRTAHHQWIDCDNGNAPVPYETYLTYTALKNGHYAVIVSNGACVDTSGIFEIMLTGMRDPSESQVILYPNPTDGNFIIDMGKVNPEALVTITRSDGQVIRKVNVKNIREIEMNLDEPAGIYVVKVMVEGGETVFRLVKR